MQGRTASLPIRPGSARPVQPGPWPRLPFHIFRLIYQRLSPIDFHATRQVCAQWYVISSDGEFAQMMLRRGGWCKSVELLTGRPLPLVLTPAETQLALRRISKEVRFLEPKGQSFVIKSTLDFRCLVAKVPGNTSPGQRKFTISVCGHFLMVAEGPSLYVYEIKIDSNGRDGKSHQSQAIGQASRILQHVTTIRCPRDILACTIDNTKTACGLAILMAGRLCLTCDIPPRFSAPVLRERGWTGVEPQRILYRTVGPVAHDPVSVAYCRSEHCLALGGLGGIELHHAHPQNREGACTWQPVDTAGDSLYFMPTPQKNPALRHLRLVVSSIVRKLPLEPPPMVSTLHAPFLWKLQHGPRIPGHTGQRYYRAVPLSDGQHILFTEPTTNYLYLGRERPTDVFSPFTLRFRFVPPAGGWFKRPRLYAAAKDTTLGARIVAVFEPEGGHCCEDHRRRCARRQAIVLYTAPPDALQDSHSSDMGGVSRARERSRWQHWMPYTHPTENGGLGTYDIHGQIVDYSANLVEVGIRAESDITIFAIDANAFGRVWTTTPSPPERAFNSSFRSSISVDENGQLHPNEREETEVIQGTRFPNGYTCPHSFSFKDLPNTELRHTP